MRNTNVEPLFLRVPKWLKQTVAEKARLETERAGEEVTMLSVYLRLIGTGIDTENETDPVWHELMGRFRSEE